MNKPLVDPEILKCAEDYLSALHNLSEKRISFHEFGHLVQGLLTKARELPVITAELELDDDRARMQRRLALSILTSISEDIESLVMGYRSIQILS